MSKYSYYTPYGGDLPSPLVPGETLIWSAKPKRNAFILNRSITMMPIAIIWLFLDLSILTNITGNMGRMGFFIIPFFLVHLMPVWIWLANLLTAGRQWKNTKYYVTDRRIIIQSGFVNADIRSIYYKEIRHVSLKIGFIDKLLGVGDIHFDLGEISYQHTRRGTRVHQVIHSFLDIEAPHEVYPIIQKTVMDIQSDIEYPNAYRPAENPGYNTKYRP